MLRRSVDPDDIVRLVNAIALTTEGDPNAGDVASRLFDLMIEGLLA